MEIRIAKEIGKKGGAKYILHTCNCGKERWVRLAGNKSNYRCRSCANLGNKHNLKHGKHGTKLYNVWAMIKQRCYNANCKAYKNYGERGIFMCSEWLVFNNFEKWALANDWQPGLTIDRINNNGDYEPTNCRFITRSFNTAKRWGEWRLNLLSIK